jgi:hypothetical protein
MYLINSGMVHVSQCSPLSFLTGRCTRTKKITLFRSDFSNETSFCGVFTKIPWQTGHVGGHSWAEY